MIRRILVIEDDDSKRAQVNAVIEKACPGANIFEAKSYQSGLKKLISDQFDLVVLDMTMPTFDLGPSEPGGRVRPFAGRDILDQVVRRNIACKAVVVTGFEILGEGENQKTLPALNAELEGLFPHKYLGSIHYDPAENEWEVKLANVIERELGTI
jgi:CheY-like chemotaxis protein